jgi:hypothetical protein
VGSNEVALSNLAYLMKELKRKQFITLYYSMSTISQKALIFGTFPGFFPHSSFW